MFHGGFFFGSFRDREGGTDGGVARDLFITDLLTTCCCCWPRPDDGRTVGAERSVVVQI